MSVRRLQLKVVGLKVQNLRFTVERQRRFQSPGSLLGTVGSCCSCYHIRKIRLLFVISAPYLISARRQFTSNIEQTVVLSDFEVKKQGR